HDHHARDQPERPRLARHEGHERELLEGVAPAREGPAHRVGILRRDAHREHDVIGDHHRVEAERLTAGHQGLEGLGRGGLPASGQVEAEAHGPCPHLKCGITFLAIRSIWVGSSMTGPSTRYSRPAFTRSSMRALMWSMEPTMYDSCRCSQVRWVPMVLKNGAFGGATALAWLAA